MSLTEQDRFYVYAYLDRRKPGNYNFGEYSFDFEPFYVGKGNARRKYIHVTPSLLSQYSRKSNRIRKMLSVGVLPKIVELHSGLSDKAALFIEKKIIRLIGRLDTNSGPLCNHTDGGDGAAGRPYKRWSEESRMLLSRVLRGKKKCPGFGQKISKRLLGNKYGLGNKSRLGKCWTELQRARFIKSKTGVALSTAHKQAILAGRLRYLARMRRESNV